MRKTSNGAVAYIGFSQKEFAASSGGGINESRGSDGKESACKVGDLGSIPGLGRYAGGGHGNPLQCSCLENPMDRGAWLATVHRITQESDTTEVT